MRARPSVDVRLASETRERRAESCRVFTFTTTDHKILVRPSKIASDGEGPGRVALVCLDRLTGFEVDQNGLAIHLVHQDESGIVADIDRSRP